MKAGPNDRRHTVHRFLPFSCWEMDESFRSARSSLRMTILGYCLYRSTFWQPVQPGPGQPRAWTRTVFGMPLPHHYSPFGAVQTSPKVFWRGVPFDCITTSLLEFLWRRWLKDDQAKGKTMNIGNSFYYVSFWRRLSIAKTVPTLGPNSLCCIHVMTFLLAASWHLFEILVAMIWIKLTNMAVNNQFRWV